MDERLHSRLTDFERFHFNHVDELIAILRDRVRWGLTDDAINTPELELIAANAGGDARVAIGILRRAARKAQIQYAVSVPRISTELGNDFYALSNPCCHVRYENHNTPRMSPMKWDATDIPFGRGAR